MKPIIIISTTIFAIIISTFLLVGVCFDIKHIFTGDWNIEPDITPLVQVIDAISEKEVEDVREEFRRSEMLDWVINCESNDDMSAIGSQGEIGILQYKQKTFDWMSDIYNLQGDIYNRQDQIKLFLLAVNDGLGDHWTCYQKWLKL